VHAGRDEVIYETRVIDREANSYRSSLTIAAGSGEPIEVVHATLEATSFPLVAPRTRARRVRRSESIGVTITSGSSTGWSAGSIRASALPERIDTRARRDERETRARDASHAPASLGDALHEADV
jgi:hypothetical protein